MTKGLARSLARGRQTDRKGAIRRHTIALSAESMTVDGAAGAGDGQLVAGQFPEGNIVFISAVAYLQFAGPTGDADLADTWEGDFSVGTTADSGDDLTGTDANIIGSTALAAATAEVSPRTRSTGVTQAIFDNTDGSLEVNVNLLVDDGDISADGIAFTVTGEIELLYSMVLDD